MIRTLMISGMMVMCFWINAPAQDTIYGPENPPPKDMLFTHTGELNDEETGKTGKDLYYSQIDLAATTDVYFATLTDEVKLSLNGSTYEPNEILQYDLNASNPMAGLLVWTGTTTLYDQAATVYTKFTLVATEQGTGNAVVMEVPDPITGNGYAGGVIHVTPGMAFQLHVLFEAGDSPDVMEPALYYYEDKTTGVNAYSSWDYGWYWVNDPPALEKLDTLKVMEGDTACLGVDQLLVTDIESHDSTIYLVLPAGVSDMPRNGTLFLDTVPLAPEDTFNMDQLKNGMVCYVHNGSETIRDSLGFRIFDSDGKSFSGTDTVCHLQVSVTPVNDPPEITVLEILQPDEGSEVTITEAYLKTEDAESDSSLITYTFDPELDDVWPKAGVVKLSGIPLNSGETFTQADISQGNLTYSNDGSMTLTDGFIFTVEDESGNKAQGPNEQEQVFFEIAVTMVNDPPRVITNMATEVDQWHEAFITASHLAASDEESDAAHITFTLVPNVEVTKEGSLYLGETALAPGDAFTMQDLIDGTVKYINGGTKATSDMIVVQISDEEGAIATDNGHDSFSHMFQITLTGQWEESTAGLSIYPNPGNGLFRISWNGSFDTYTLFNILGEELEQGNISGRNEMELDLGEHTHGLYLIRLNRNGETSVTRRIILK